LGELVILRPRADAPIQVFAAPAAPGDAEIFAEPAPTPRAHFGQRPPHDIFRMAGGVDRVLDAFTSDRARRTERVLEAVKDALSGKAPEPRKVCPTLLIAAAGRANGIAASARDMARELESLGCVRAARTFYDLADVAETAAAEVEAPAHPEGA